jgi:hypothetical protein
MKDITGLLAVFLSFSLISLLSVDRTQNSGLVTSRGKLDSSPVYTDIAQLHQHRTDSLNYKESTPLIY